MNQSTYEKRRKRIFEIIEVGTEYDYVSRIYDFFNAFCIILNLAVSILYTFDNYREQYGALLSAVEEVTVALFMIDYILRVWTAKYLYPELPRVAGCAALCLFITGLVDLLSFLPQYLPFFFPEGAVGIPYAADRADLSAFPHQCLL